MNRLRSLSCLEKELFPSIDNPEANNNVPQCSLTESL
jgi:hypothetical protein